ncbi:MAG TPA: glycoside hydrolase domain-containing protein [Actinocrinis sp.]|nr:glycoside hydrolase domain-containing protein [Actinocrinis sp.]
MLATAGAVLAVGAMWGDSGADGRGLAGAGAAGAGGVAARGGQVSVVLPSVGSSAADSAGSRQSAGGGRGAAAPAEVSTVARSVSYLGHVFTVPAGWHLVDLAADTGRCVRFDVHAVYFGSPSNAQRCTAHGGAVRSAMLVAPSSVATKASAVDDAVNQRITATLRGVQITASYSYGTDRSSAVAVLSADGVPAPTVSGASGASEGTGAVAQRVAANLAPVQGRVSPSGIAVMTQAYKGLGFDACTAPSGAQMSAWGKSPFGAVGVYIGGAERACTQPNLTASWVSAESSAGWRMLPLYVGPQISYGDVTNAAAAQGKASADDAAIQASSLGIGQSAVLYYDMEGGDYTSAQTAAAQTFLAAWTAELHALHYRSAVYGNESGAVGALVSGWGTIAEPDVIDVANWNGTADDDPGADPADHWGGHRVHQFQGGTNATYGAVTINIDQDFFGLAAPCGPALATGSGIVPRYMTGCSASPAPAPVSTPSPAR